MSDQQTPDETRRERWQKPIEIGQRTRWGKVAARGVLSGERYYWMLDKHGTVSMMPASAVESPVTQRPGEEGEQG